MRTCLRPRKRCQEKLWFPLWSLGTVPRNRLLWMKMVLNPVGTTSLWQRSYTVVVDVVTRLWHGRKWELCWRRFPMLWQRRSLTLSARCDNVTATSSQYLTLDFWAILLQTILISFPLSKRDRVTKVLRGIKHTSPVFKRTLYLKLTKVYANQVKYMKFNLFTMNTIIHFFT